MRTNIVFITIDCLRSDSLGITNKNVKTPFIDSLAKKGVFFRNTIASSPWSGGSGPSIFTGTYPFSNNGNISLRDRGESFVEILRKEGYLTIGIHSNPFFTAENDYNKGFDYFYDWYTSSNKNIHKVKTKLKFKKKLKKIVKKSRLLEFFINLFVRLKRQITRNLLKRISTNYASIKIINNICKNAVKFYSSKLKTKPIFIWLHYMDSHEPITIPQDSISPRIRSKRNYLNSIYRNKKVKKSKQDIKELKRLYYDSISYIDANIEKTVNYLNRKLDKQTIYIITADHGQGFGENKEHFGHGLVHLKELLNIPLIIYSQKLKKQKISVNSFVPLQAIGNVILKTIGYEESFGSLEAFIDSNLNITPPPYVIAEEGREQEKDFISKGSYKLNWSKRSFSVFRNNMYFVYYYQTDTEELYRFKDNKNVISDPKYKIALKEFRHILKKHIKNHYKKSGIVNKIRI